MDHFGLISGILRIAIGYIIQIDIDGYIIQMMAFTQIMAIWSNSLVNDSPTDQSIHEISRANQLEATGFPRA